MGMLENKKAVLTGGAQGLGKALARHLANEGCDVLIGDLNGKGAEETATEVADATGRKVIGMKVDISQDADVKAFFDKAVDEFGRVDVVVANAAVLIAEAIAEANPEKWRIVMNVNLFGYFLTTKYAAKIMKEQKSGSIIQINSKSGKKGSAANSAYAASKFGGIGHTQSVALELAPFGIRCNSVCPGNLLDSPLWTDPEKGLFVQYFRAGKVPGAKSVEDVRQFYINQVPMRRGCSYEDIGNVVTFLASEKAGYMTGQAINVTGGQEMK
ncbi:sorbitol-6-phosphate dehydrogenase [PVC group bacterium]|nr:sorbitol-6-phosphate dehydrogenase [PVC group bacterium]